ncbi:Receptor-like protein 15 [Linum grandiflorum]
MTKLSGGDANFTTHDLGWNVTSDPCQSTQSSWRGVGCDDNQSVTSIILSGFRFSGTLDPELLCSAAKSLTVLWLENNTISGQIPESIATCTSLKILDLYNNSLSGPIPDSIVQLSNLTGINLANNNFSGEIPEEFGDLTTIRLMNLSHNELTGPIPSAFSSLDQMESLDISYNNLTGSIPPQLVDLHSLAVFSVAYNNLSGKTPERIAQFATFDQDCYDGNPFLCGWPLPTKCSTPREMPSPALMPFAEEDSDGEAGIIDMEVFAASFTVSFGMVLLAIAAVLYINENWRRVWFYYVEVVMTGCYYFMVDHLPVPAKFRVLDSSSSGVLSW